MSPADDIKDMILADSSLDLAFASSLFVNKEPAKPDNTVTIFDTPGFPPYMGFTDVGYEYPSIQIRVRNRSQEDGWNLINEIYLLLHGRAHETWNNAIYESIRASGSIALLDWDDNGRVRFIINFNIQRKQVAEES
jgi:hypothetical protein